MGGGDQNQGGAAAIPVDDVFKWMLSPPVTPEQTDAWFQPPAASPSALPEPPPYQQPQFAANLGRAVSEIGPELQGMVQAPVEFAKKTADPSLSVPQRLAAAVGAVASASQLDPLMPHAGEVPSKIPAGEGFVWGAKPLEDIQGLPKSGVMPESRFAKAGSEAGQFSNDELALMKQVVPDAFTEGGVDVPKLHEGLAQSGPVVEVKKLGASSDPVVADQERQQVRHQLDTQLGPNWVEWNRSDRRREAITDNQRNMLDRYYELEDIVGQGPAGTTAQYGFVGPKPESQMPGYVEGLVRLPAKGDIRAGTVEAARVRANELYRGPHFGAEDTNVLSSYRGYEETLPNGEKAFHVIEVQSDWGQRQRHVDEQLSQGLRHPEEKVPGHPLLPHYETLGLKAAIQHAKEIGATKVILPDAETAMMTEGHDRAAVAGPQAHTPEEGFIKPTVPQEGGMRLHYDQTLPSAMRKLTGDKGTPVDLGTHKAAKTPDITRLNRLGLPTQGSPVFKDAAGKPKTNITGKIYDISKTPDQFKLMKAGDKFSAARYLAS